MKARKKPVEVECFEFTSYDDVMILGKGVPYWFLKLIEDGKIDKFKVKSDDEVVNYWVTIKTLEGDMRVSVGDYIIRGVQGECYPCKPDIFKETYDILEEE